MSVNTNIFRVSILSGIVITMMSLTACSTMPFKQNIKNIKNIINPSPTGAFEARVNQRTVSQRLQDRSIERTAKANLKKLHTATLGASRIEIDSFDHKVLITGEVPNEAAKMRIQEIVASMPEVETIYNQLKIGRQHSLSYKVHDAYINSKLTQKIMRSKSIKISQVDITTENGVVYVMGRLTQYQQQHLIKLANNTQGILELVLLTTIIPDAPQSHTELTYPSTYGNLNQQSSMNNEQNQRIATYPQNIRPEFNTQPNSNNSAESPNFPQPMIQNQANPHNNQNIVSPAIRPDY